MVVPEQTNGSAVQLFGTFNPKLFRNHDALTVVIDRRCKFKSQRSVTAQCHGGLAAQNIYLAGLKGCETLLRGQRDKLDLRGIPESCGGD